MQPRKLPWVGLFAIAMAYLEAAVVVYLRRIYGISDLILNVPPFDPQIAAIELGRELATLIMLLAVGWAVGNTQQARLSFAFYTFGLWDIFYYIWLRVFIQWPKTPLDPDLLFLIPLPWWGPVLSPVLVAMLMVVSGVLVIIQDDNGITVKFRTAQWVALAIGMLLMLYTFMADAIAALPADAQALSQVKPTEFNWPVYLIGLGLVAFAIVRAVFTSASQPADYSP